MNNGFFDYSGAYHPYNMPPPMQPLPAAGQNALLNNSGDNSIAHHDRVKVKDTARPPRNEIIPHAEITIFAAKWRTIPMVAVRFEKNGITRQMTSEMHLQLLGLADNRDANKKYLQKVKKQYHQGGLLYYAVEDEEEWASEKSFPEDDLTSNEWYFRDCYRFDNPPTKEWQDIPLRDFYGHIPRNEWPKGQDRGAMTKVFEMVQDFGDGSETTADWENLIAMAMLDETLLTSIDPNKSLDQEAAEAYYA